LITDASVWLFKKKSITMQHGNMNVKRFNMFQVYLSLKCFKGSKRRKCDILHIRKRSSSRLPDGMKNCLFAIHLTTPSQAQTIWMCRHVLWLELASVSDGHTGFIWNIEVVGSSKVENVRTHRTASRKMMIIIVVAVGSSSLMV
jgi:hypothetical protein